MLQEVLPHLCLSGARSGGWGGEGQACASMPMCGVCLCKGEWACQGLSLTCITFLNSLTIETGSQVKPGVRRLGTTGQGPLGILQVPPLQVWDSREARLSPLYCLYGYFSFTLGSSCLPSKPFADGAFAPAPNKWFQTRAFLVVSFEFS